MNQEQINFYQNKLAFEMDPADLFDALQKKENVVVIDTRKPVAYQKEHIPQALNLPHREMNAESTKHLDKTKIYVCYCDGIGCNASTKGSLNLSKLGFQVKELIGGIQWWKFDGYGTEGTEKSSSTSIECAC